MGSMPRRSPHVIWIAVPLAIAYFFGLNGAGLLGPDEPRYAAIAREMARSGDWITPRLWGAPWFEKPALLYWMSAAGFRLGLGPELAPRLPVATLALAFLAVYWWLLRREFGDWPAWCATAILGTSVGWMGFSQIGVTDLPMTAAFAAAMLFALRWIAKGDARFLPLTGALLGVAVLAKGLVPLVLAAPLGIAPLVSKGRLRIRDLISVRVVAPFLLVALPWYLLCYLRNGREFIDIFFWQQQVGRLHSSALLHTQQWWFYIPILLLGLLPWTPFVALGLRRANWRDPRRAFLMAWVLFGLIFFSAAVNKLPGYVLPLLPALCALIGIGLAETKQSGVLLACSAVLLVIFPVAIPLLPAAVAEGLSRAPGVRWQASWLLPLAVSGTIWLLSRRGKTWIAVAVVGACSAAGLFYVKAVALPDIDRVASARSLWHTVEGEPANVCVDTLTRSLRYGLNYYSDVPLPDCSERPVPWEIRQPVGGPPYIGQR
jgi:4-amino-4-deoxy-L-arabinose transferase-like glycosyltransferase